MANAIIGSPKFSKEAQDKFLANEEENAYVQLEVFGDPPPKVEWFMVRVMSFEKQERTL